ncbi:MAG: hypothetical protein EOP05_11695 [Proteobacteria bacterium]|nr:MAG: hypothetical protein EOP05_11695 [Pseudomonadota bacterium]
MKQFASKYAARFASFVLVGLITVISVFTTSAAYAQLNGQSNTQTRDEEIEALKARIQKLEQDAAKPSDSAAEITKLQLELQLPDPLGAGFTGLGPAASKVYTSKSPLSLGALAEARFVSETSEESEASLSAANIFFGARLSNWLIFNGSYSLQSRTPNNVNNTHVQFAYVDFLLGDEAGIRAGNFLIPFGVTNLRFEPTLYPMVNRPRAERMIIPTDWNENGILGFYRVGPVVVQAGVVNGGDIGTAQPVSWIREGRQGANGARSESLGYFARVETAARRANSGRPSPFIGASIYSGSWAQGEDERFGDANVLLAEVHAGGTWKRLRADVLYTEGTLSDAGRVSTALTRAIGSKARGATATLQYNLLSSERAKARSLYHELPIFVAYEIADAQSEVASGFTKQDDSRIASWTFGMNYLPHEQVVVKANYVLAYDRQERESRAFETAIGITF